MATTWGYLAGMLVLIVVGVSVVRERTKKNFKEVPGAVPVLGHLHLIAMERLPTLFDEWADAFGVCEFRLLNQKWLLLADGEAVESLGKHRARGNVRTFKPIAEAYESLVKGVLSAEGQDWAAQRRLITPGFSHANLATFIPALRVICDSLVDAITSEEGIVDDLLALCTRFTAGVIGKLSFGLDFALLQGHQKTTTATSVHALFEETMQVLNARSLDTLQLWRVPVLGDWLDGGAKVRNDLKRLITDIIDQANRKQKDQANRKQKEPSTTTVLDKMLEANCGEDKKLDDVHLIGNLVTLFGAGTETTAATLTWMVYQAAFDNELQGELRTEARAFLSSDDAAETNFKTVLAALPRHRSLFWETLRLRGPSPFLVVDNVEPIQLPTGETLSPNDYAIVIPQRWLHKQPKLGGPTFDARRWLTADATSFQKNDAGWLPFGFHSRICPGKDLAELEACLATAHILAAFDDLALVDKENAESLTIPSSGSSKEGTWEEPQLFFNFTEKPDRPIRLRLRRASSVLSPPAPHESHHPAISADSFAAPT